MSQNIRKELTDQRRQGLKARATSWGKKERNAKRDRRSSKQQIRKEQP